MLTRLVKRYKIESGKKSRKGTVSEFLGSLLLGDVLSGLPKSNSFACEGFNINRTKSCPMNGGKLRVGGNINIKGGYQWRFKHR